MSLVNITNISVQNNPAKCNDPFKFEITFECLSTLESDLEFKIIYVGSAEDDKYDQILDSIMVGPVPVGVNKFVFEADAPNISMIPKEDLIGVTVVLITCSYREREFVRVGYYVSIDYEDEKLRETPTPDVDVALLCRNVLSDQPRVTRFPIPWDGEEEVPPEVTAAEVDDEPVEDLFDEEDDENEDDEEDPDEVDLDEMEELDECDAEDEEDEEDEISEEIDDQKENELSNQATEMHVC